MRIWWWALAAAGAIGLALLGIVLSIRRSRAALVELARLAPLCLALLRDLVREPAVPRRSKLIAGFALLYFVSPIDLIPDFIPVVGHLDDALVVAWAMRHLVASAGPEVVASRWKGEPEQLERVLRLARVRGHPPP